MHAFYSDIHNYYYILDEKLKTMHSIKFGLSHHAQMMLLRVTNVCTDMAAKTSIEISDNFS
jgi:hypothetical protein